MYEAVSFGALGLIVGSFLNVLILRWGKRELSGRSECVACHRTLPWYDLIPILSWIMLRGRCRACGVRISAQYILVEASTGSLFVLIGLAPLPLFFRSFALPIAALLLAIAVYDLRHTLIPDVWVYICASLSLLASLIAIPPDEFVHLAPLVFLSGPALASPLFALWFFSRGAWMGLGDVKLTLVIGWLLGLAHGFEALFLAFVLGAFVSIPLLFFSSSLWVHVHTRFTPMLTSRKPLWGFTMKSEIPFGPFLILATLCIWIVDMYGIILLLSFT